jgi:hypothetical protein
MVASTGAAAEYYHLNSAEVAKMCGGVNVRYSGDGLYYPVIHLSINVS